MDVCQKLLVGLQRAFVGVYRPLCALLVLACPYVTIAADRAAFAQRGYIAHGGEFLVPIFFFLAIFALKDVGDRFRVKFYPRRCGMTEGEFRRAVSEAKDQAIDDYKNALIAAIQEAAKDEDKTP